MNWCWLFVCAVLTCVSCREGSGTKKEDGKSEETLRCQKYGPVIFANLIFRHGDRTIMGTYPHDPHLSSPHWRIGLGQLTREGKERHYKLGKYIRSTYGHLLGDNYSVDKIKVISSDIDRTLMSAQCNLAAIYPAPNGSSLPIQPVPIHSLPRDKDNLLYMNATCPKLAMEEKEFLKSDYMKGLDQELANLYATLSNHTGHNITNIKTISKLYDALKIEHEDYGLKLPNWTNEFYPEPLRNLSYIYFLSKTHTNTMKRLLAGPLVTDMTRHLVKKAGGNLRPNRSLWLYSGHDSTLVAVLNAMGLASTNISLPSYASLLALQLRMNNQSKPFVTIMYKDGNEDEAVELRMKECGEDACTLDKFQQLTRHLMVENWAEECSIHRNPFIQQMRCNNSQTADWTRVILIGIFIICLLGLLYYYCKPRKQIKYSRLNVK